MSKSGITEKPERPKYTEAEKLEFRLDAEGSYAEFVIEPYIYPGGRVYHAVDRLCLRPYPNPLGLGGWSGMVGPVSLAELMRRLRSWKENIAPWQEIGLSRISVKRLPARYCAERSESSGATPASPPRSKSKPAIKVQQMSLL